MSTLLKVRGLEAAYGDLTVLRGLDFDLAEGGATTLLGANGAGKTTTLRALCGMTRRSGEIVFGGTSIARKSTEEIVRMRIAHVPEGRGTLTTFSVEENLRLGAITRPAGKEIATDIERVYGYFPALAERRLQQAGTLSGGEQQMLAIGRALMLRPRLMLLDEPSFGLAPLVVAELFKMLDRVRHTEAVSLLIVEQNAELALSITDHAYLLETGMIVKSGPSAEIREDKAVRKSYLGY
jgi:branched-chain amino acid transport system ATP-binding protein